MSKRSKWVYIVGTVLVILLCAAIAMTALLALGRIRIGTPDLPDIGLDLPEDLPSIDPPGGGGGGGTGGGGDGPGIPGDDPAQPGDDPGGSGDDPAQPGDDPGGSGDPGGEPGDGSQGEWGDVQFPDFSGGGSGGTGGSGSGSGSPMLDESGQIGAPEGGGESGSGGTGGGSLGFATVALTVYADEDARVYFRYKSFGDYTGQAWGGAVSYPVAEGYGMNYLPSYRLGQGAWNSVWMKIIVNGTQYLQPYYFDLDNEEMGGENYTVQTDDVVCSGSTELPYSLWCYDYDYVRDGLPREELPADMKPVEAAYRAFVYENYLSVPDGTNELLQSIIAERGWNKNREGVIAEIAQYIKNVARYDSGYDRALDQEEDIVSAFLTRYRAGVCQHFASAATLLYRALGIPARYVIGYVGDTQANTYVNILSSNAHAWVEVYLDGFGWVNVEVTGSAGSGDSWGGDVIAARPLRFISSSASKMYDGQPLRADVTLQTWAGDLLPGHSYAISSRTQLTSVGKTVNLFRGVRILDEDGNDVTYLYAIEKEYGVLEVEARPITLVTGSATKEYDGTPLTCADYTLEGYYGLVEGHRMRVELSGARTERGKSENGVVFLTIYDEDGNDVTGNYAIEVRYGTLRVI